MGRAVWLSWRVVHRWTPTLYHEYHGWMSHLHRPGKWAYLTYGLHHHMGSSRWSPGLWWGPDSPGNPRFVQLCGMGPCDCGNPMISHVMNVIREREIDALVTPWVNAWVAYLLVVWWATATVEDEKIAAGVLDPTEYNEVVTTNNTEMIASFSPHIIDVRTRIACTGVRLNVLTQALHAEDGSLPQGLMIQNAYTKMHDGSKNVTVIVRNSVTYPQTLRKKTPVAGAVVAK